MVNFKIIEKGKNIPSDDINTGYLRIDNWNDYSFVTMFFLTIFDRKGTKHEIGNLKIGFEGQKEEVSTHSTLEKIFTNLKDDYFSLGDSLEYYKNLNNLDSELKMDILTSLKDIIINTNRLSDIENESVLNTSLLRSVTLSDIHGQFSRVLNGLDELSDFDFDFKRRSIEGFSDLDISFKVEVDSIPSTNIHAFIGRNGCGKTTILNGMIEAITDPANELVYFTDNDRFSESRIPKGYFRSLVSVSFSAFDPFSPPQDQPDPAKGTRYFYIGLKSPENPQRLKSLEDLRLEFVSALIGCLRSDKKKEIWSSAIKKLNSDQNFANMELSILNTRYEKLKDKKSKIQVDSDKFRDYLYEDITKYLSRMSSGHAIVLFTITRLVDTVGEKSLVLLDEPEGHLHPPLLSAFLRTLSDLLDARNGVAIIATHSPVVLQEIPKSCVWKVIRSREAINIIRPEIETFGENLGVLTREVFSLEVANSGYHYLLSQSVESGLSYKRILAKYSNQIGLEGRTVLKAMVLSRDEGNMK
ncbi:AAA family ATPase [Yersinia rochesterensis]|uniref:AAA family ATPase n=1 Tax=Yersinia TaxID=629 RepID=UPI002240DC29|nr:MULTISPECIES: AAA family ATPase [Yersinia]MDA5543835.1 AAA family ATPase [Yersinia rochesterensis]UZM74460.1 AAA family ATPase [Yersinia sp. SCPM-O-B-9106 (C-191)]